MKYAWLGIVLVIALLGITIQANAIVQLTVDRQTIYPGETITLSWNIYGGEQVSATVYMVYNNQTAPITTLTNETSYSIRLDATGNYEFYVVVTLDDNTTVESNHVSVAVIEQPVNQMQSLFYAMLAITVPLLLLMSFIKIIGKHL